MSEQQPKRETMFIEEATVSDVWEIAVNVGLHERLGRIIEMGQRVAKETTQ